MVKCLVTGGCGFIGSNLVHKLFKNDWHIDVVDDMSAGDLSFLEGTEFRTVHADLLHVFENEHEANLRASSNLVLVMTGDFSHENILKRIKRGTYDYIFHLAARPRVAYSVKEPVETTEVNLFKTTALFHAACDNVKRVIFSSSSSVYGNAQQFPTPESTAKNPQSPYALQKWCCEQFASMFHKLYGLDIVSLRYFNVYGPHQYGDSPYATAIGAWCHATQNNLSLRSDGDGTQVRDLTYVGDVAQANLLAAICEEDIGGLAFNVGCGNPHSNNEILSLFKDKFTNIKIANAPWRLGDVMKTHADISLAKEKLGYNPSTQLTAGLKKTLEWWGLKEENEVA
jgi:nucleoside-diphosphate-sugar epimerase